jgi:hypothetical protein
MTESAVYSKPIPKQELAGYIGKFKSKYSSFFSYKETVEKLELRQGLEDEIPEDFQLLRLFTEQEEWTIRPLRNGFLLVSIGEGGDDGMDDARSIAKKAERTLFLDQNVTGSWKELEIIEYTSHESGGFTRWKGVRG